MEAGKDFDTVRDVPDLSGKVAVVTGGTAGIGRETILTFAKHNCAHIYFTGRNMKSATILIQEVEALRTQTNISFLECDFESLASVLDAAKAFTRSSERLDLLLCNAGVMALPPGLTKDGYEVQFGTNHMAHALLIDTLHPILLQTARRPAADVRIVMTSSDGYRIAKDIAFDKLRTKQDMWIMGALQRYCQSKLANVLYAQELARQYPEITTVSIHPGVIRTALHTNSTRFTQTLIDWTSSKNLVPVEEGIKNGLWSATTSKDKIVNGSYYEPVGILGKKTAAAANRKLASDLWDWTQAELKRWHNS